MKFGHQPSTQLSTSLWLWKLMDWWIVSSCSYSSMLHVIPCCWQLAIVTWPEQQQRWCHQLVPLSTLQLREQINSHTLKTSPPVNNFQGRQKPSQGLSRFCASTSIIMYKYSSSSLAGFLSILVRSGIESLCLWIEKNVAELPASLR